MLSLRNGVRVSGLLLAMSLAPAAWAQSDALKKAVELYDQHDYPAAQEALIKVDRNKLNDAEKTELDAYLNDVKEAIRSTARAEQDLQAADEAFEGGRWDESERLYRAVTNNAYTKAAVREQAARRLKQIADKRELAQAVSPPDRQPVRVAAQEEPMQDKPAQPMAQDRPMDAQDTPAQAQPESQRLTLTEQMRREDELQWQRAVAKMNEQITLARQAVADQDFTSARTNAQTALQIIEAARAYAEPAARYAAARRIAEDVRTEVNEATLQAELTRAEAERREIIDRSRVAKERQELKRRETIEQLFNSAAQLRRENRFREAAEMLRQILFIDPANAKARDQLEVANDYASLTRQLESRGDFERNMRDTFVDADEALIPWAVEVLYPRNWRELSIRRDLAGVGVSGESEEGRELNRKLEQSIPDVSFQEQPFESLVDWMGEISQINMSVDWEDLENNGIERDKPVTLKLANLPFRTVLTEILTQVGGEVRLAFDIADGLLKIATKEKLDRDKEIRVYDINDLLVNIPRFTNAAQLNPGQALNQAGQGGQGGGGGGGGGGGQLFQDDEEQGGEAAGEGGAGRAAQAEQIMEIIRQTVEPDSWRETGGGDGSMRELNGQLIVYNTSDSHRQVTDLLGQLRKFRALQIAIETRFLTVSNNFLEEIGVDLDFVFNSGTAGFDQGFTGAGVPVIDPFTGASVLVPRTFTNQGGLPNVPAFPNQFTNPITGGPVGAAPTGFGQPFQHPSLVPQTSGIPPQFNDLTPLRAAQNSLSLVNPSNFNTGVPGSFANVVGNNPPALSIAGSFLDNLQVDFLIRATQANSRSSVVQAPRLILFNGQRSNIFVGRSQTYVASLAPQIAQQAVAFQPVIGVAQSGSSLDVEATISADRRYVTVTVQTQRAQDPILTRFEVQRSSGNAPGAFITTVDQQSASVNTTVSIPDGGTVLLGGLKLVGEFEVEAGVPVLSKIPVLKRAFTNTTTIKDTQTLLILMKAKVIIQQEAEEEAFPTMISAGG
jgi:general secretion pathway protein D